VAEVFDHFVVSVIERLSATDESAVRAVETVLQRWRQFLIAPSGPPGRDRLAEILSELLVVSDAVHASGVPRIGFWVGPFGAHHDMRCGSVAVEVKTTRSHTGHRVTIHGEDQLLAPEQGFPYDLEYVCGRTTSAAARRNELFFPRHSSTYSTVT
jgi:hypothetical protein